MQQRDRLELTLNRLQRKIKQLATRPVDPLEERILDEMLLNHCHCTERFEQYLDYELAGVSFHVDDRNLGGSYDPH